MKGRGPAGRSAAPTLKLSSSSCLWKSGRGRTLQRSPSNGLIACWRRKGERVLRGSKWAWEPGVPLCPTHRSTAHWEPLERACAEQSLGQAGGRRSCFLATPINLLGIAPSEGMRLDSLWREATPPQECWAAAFSHSPKFLRWNKIRGECWITFLLALLCCHPGLLQRLPPPPR